METKSLTGYKWSIKSNAYHYFIQNKSACGKEYSFLDSTIPKVPVDEICKDCLGKIENCK